LGITSEDYVSIYSNRAKANEETADKTTDEVWATIAKNKKRKKLKVDFKTITGAYKDNWFGNVVISEQKGKLYFQSERSSQLAGEVFFTKRETML
jgi:hypothetical protein